MNVDFDCAKLNGSRVTRSLLVQRFSFTFEAYDFYEELSMWTRTFSFAGFCFREARDLRWSIVQNNLVNCFKQFGPEKF